MNVIKFDIEVKKILKEYQIQFWRQNADEVPIKDLVKTAFQNVSSFEGDYNIALSQTWEGLDHDNIRNLNSSAYLIGYFTVNNTKVYLFELKSKGITGLNNISIQVYAHGILSIEDILNESFSQIKKILKELDCSLVNKSIIYIFPYNTGLRDIESTDLKIKANLNSTITFGLRDYLRLLIVFVLSTIFLITALSLDATSDYRVIFRALFGSGIFYILIDLTINIVIPFVATRHKKIVTIDNLSSVVEKTNEVETLGKADELKIPEA